MVQPTGSPPGDGLTLSTEISGASVVLRVSGVVDMLTASTLTRQVDALLDTAPSWLIIDLSDVTFLASAGLEALVIAQHRAGSTTELAVVADGPITRRPITLTAVDQSVRVYATEGEAREALDDR